MEKTAANLLILLGAGLIIVTLFWMILAKEESEKEETPQTLNFEPLTVSVPIDEIYFEEPIVINTKVSSRVAQR